MSRKILIADDEAHIRHVLSMKLANAGYDVVTAADGEEALEMCLAEKPDLMCTDYQMPFMSGLELCQELQKHEETRNMPILMLTAREFDIEAHQQSSGGILDVLSKPFSPREVLAKVQELIGGPDAGEGREAG